MSKAKTRSPMLAIAAALMATAALAHAETVRKGEIQVAFKGKISPQHLPRSYKAPVSVLVGAKVSSTGSKPPPQLHKMSIAINRFGTIDPQGLPVCKLKEIQPSTTADALTACRHSLVGEGTFSARVSGRAPFPSTGKLYAFNGVVSGRPAILAHVYSRAPPAPASFTLEFIVGHARGTFGTILSAKLPKTRSGGSITGISLSLGKTFRSHGKRHSYISASCPAPKDVNVASFPFAKASLGFVGGKTVSQTLNRSCTARG